MSGRGLGHTGGTLDKLESIPGFHIELTIEQFIENVNQLNLAVVGQSGNLTPADKLLYSLRDVTATVDSIPLIASSIMSKKIAAGADAIVLDVKTGSGAFMKTLSDAEQLAEAMVQIGKQLHRQTVSVISDMNQPLGRAIGNALEMKEAIGTLRGEGPQDLTQLSLSLGAYMLISAGYSDQFEIAYAALERAIRSGNAIDKLKQFIQAQGGNPAVVDDTSLLPQAPYQIQVTADLPGYVHAIAAEEMGTAAMLLGAGRATKDDPIDLSVGIELLKKIGDEVRQGEAIAIIHANQQDVAKIEQQVRNAFVIEQTLVQAPQLIYQVIQ